MPAEWEKHEATWLSYPHNEDSWPGKIESIFPSYHLFIKTLTEVETVHINVQDDIMEQNVRNALKEAGAFMVNIEFHRFPTNDAWCRDHGPAFLLNHKVPGLRAIVNWNHNAWGGKYPYDLDTQIPERIAEHLGMTMFQPNIVMEGGSIDVNGKGDLLTTTSCLLNPNRNPRLSAADIEERLLRELHARRVLWLHHGHMDGDDTDAHIDTLARLCPADTIAYVQCTDPDDGHYDDLQHMEAELRNLRTLEDRPYRLLPLPLPAPVYDEDDGTRLPATYANFLVLNGSVLVPTYAQPELDRTACETIQKAFPTHQVVGIDCRPLIRQHGSLHCCTMQLPRGVMGQSSE